MFTGIIEHTGIVSSVKEISGGKRLTILVDFELNSVVGASISVNGCCTTIVELGNREFSVELMPVTLEKTTLGKLAAGSKVNLERPLKIGDELGGHFVQGHVDGVGRVVKTQDYGDSTVLEIEIPAEFTPYVVKTGSIALNGVSLTLSDVNSRRIQVGLIPHTKKETTFSDVKLSDEVNIEVDVLAKYIEKQTAAFRK